MIEDERGAVLHMMRADRAVFAGFGEAYFSEINPGIRKAWKRHHRSTQHLAVPRGQVRFALYDDRRESPSHGRIELHELGRPGAYHLLTIPPLVWYAWRCLGDGPALVANCTDLPHDPAESDSIEILAATEGWEW